MSDNNDDNENPPAAPESAEGLEEEFTDDMRAMNSIENAVMFTARFNGISSTPIIMAFQKLLAYLFVSMSIEKKSDRTDDERIEMFVKGVRDHMVDWRKAYEIQQAQKQQKADDFGSAVDSPDFDLDDYDFGKVKH